MKVDYMNKKIRLKSNIKYQWIGILCSTIVVLFGILIILLAHEEVISMIVGIFGLLLGSALLLHSFYFVQWAVIYGESVAVYCIFGKIKEIELKKIRKWFSITKMEQLLKNGFTVYIECIVICETISVKSKHILDTINRKKQKYILLPYNSETSYAICEAYLSAVGKMLDITKQS